MKFIEKYWWVLLILVIVAIVLYMYFSKDTAKTPTTTTTDPCVASKYATQIAGMETQIDANPTWKSDLEGKLTNASDACFGKTYEQCRRINAIWQLKTEGVIPFACVFS